MFNRIKIENIGPIIDIEITDINSMQSPIIIMGDNGSGKSHVLDSIAFALTGEFPSKLGSTFNRVRHGESSGSVSVDFAHGEHEYTITRKIDVEKNKNTANVWMDGKKIAGPSVRAVDQYIEENIVVKNDMLMTNFSSQFRKGDFAAMDPADRKRVLAEMLGLEFGDYLPRYQKEKREIDKKFETTQAELNVLNGGDDDIPVEIELESVKQQIAECKQNLHGISENKQSLANKQQELATLFEQFNNNLTRAKELHKIIDIYNQYIKDLSNPAEIDQEILKNKENLDTLKSTLVTLRNDNVTLITQVATINQAVVNAEETASTLDNVPCGNTFPLCPFIKSGLEAKNKLPDLTTKKTDIKKEADVTLEKFQQIERNAKIAEETLIPLYKAQSIIKEHPEVLQIESMVAEYQEILPLISDTQRDNLTIMKSDLQQEMETTRSSETFWGSKLNGLMEAMGRLDSTIIAQKKNQARKEGLQSLLSELDHQQKVLEMIVNGFGIKGVQPLIIEISIPEICSIANDMLGMVSDGDLSVNLQTVQETKQSTQRETMAIEVSSSDGRTGDLTEFSGAEQLMVGTCLRAALIVFKMRRGAGLPFLCADEAFGAYDPAHRGMAMQMFTKLSEMIPQIILISHQPEVFAEAGTTILVSKNNGEATVEVV